MGARSLRAMARKVGAARDKLRHVQGQEPSTDAIADEVGSTPEQREQQECLVSAIKGLPEQQQKVLHLYYYEELTLKEIGAVLEVSESRVCQVHGAAVKKLRKVVRGGESYASTH